MFDYKRYFETFCREKALDIQLSFRMLSGYETANGTFDLPTKTLFINAGYLQDLSDYKKAFYLFHELRHAEQYLFPERFGESLRRSLAYVIQYDGTCYKLVDGEYLRCKIDGSEEDLGNRYLGQPYELDANTFAYEETKKLYGDSEELRELYRFWLPKTPITEKEYEAIYAEIDEKIKV